MKQGEAARPNLDLDDLERQLAAAAAPRRNGSDDPLAELARIVGYNDRPATRPSAKAAGSFDDFLVNPPRSVSDMMGTQTNRNNAIPPVAPLLEPAGAPAARVPDMPPIPPIPASAASPTSLQDQLAAALGEFEPRLRPTLPIEEPGSAAPPPQAESPATSDIAQEAPAMAAETAPPLPVAETSHSDPRFEEMLKEFDAAMRDVGARPLQAQAPAMESAEPYAGPTVSPALAYDPDSETAAHTPIQPRRSRFGMALAGGAIGVALIGAAGLLTFGGSSRSTNNGAAPVIAAKPGVTKERPANPGGVEVPNQDKEILSRGPSTPQAERVAPREEQPVDLAQAQRNAETPPAVRQIPGVLVVGPSTTQPPSNQTASSQPAATAPAPAQPRPVASVPITIAGQPPGDTPTITAPTIAPTQPSIPAAPTMTRPTAALPTQPTAPVAAAPVTTTPPAVTAPAQPQAAANSQNASSEPRRVRAVPIRPDEGAPNRAQAQPRVVPAQPARPTAAAAAPAAEADDGNAPLRITPQANRGASGASRAAALAPAAVPASTPVPTTTQSTSSEAAPSSGGSFAVQIAAEGSQDAAQAKFNRMRAQHSGVLGGASPTIRSAEVNGRAVYRVRVGQMSREEAVSLCERLKADGGSCFVARN